MSSVHLLVLIHGMWGNPAHLAEMDRVVREERSRAHADETTPADVQLEVLIAQTNREESTYDGIDWGGERVADEIEAEVKKIEGDGRKVTRFSVTGYSLGGLVARYVIGVLLQRHFFDTVSPVNFNTFATPHIGIPRYPTTFSSLAFTLGPMLLSRTGEQFYTSDNWSNTGKPLLEIMSDPNRIFYQALKSFPNIAIYANSINDTTVPYVTAAIEIEDIFAQYSTNGIDIELDQEYSPLIKSYALPASPPPPPPKPAVLSADWFKSLKPRIILPPALQLRFPLNIVVIAFIPVLIPAFISAVLVRLSLAARSSRARIRLLENEATSGSSSNAQRLAYVLAQLEKGMDDVVADLIDSEDPVSSTSPSSPGTSTPVPIPSTNIAIDPNSSNPQSTVVEQSRKSKRGDPKQPILNASQLRMVVSLNALPHLHKHLVFLPNLRNSHGTIVCRDVTRFPGHRAGAGGLRHWADHFVL